MKQIKYLLLFVMSVMNISVFSQIVDYGSDIVIQNVTLNKGESFSNLKNRVDLFIGSSVYPGNPIGNVVLKAGSNVSVQAATMRMEPNIYIENGANIQILDEGVPTGRKSISGKSSYSVDYFYFGAEHEGVVLGNDLCIGSNRNNIIGYQWQYGVFNIGSGDDFLIENENGNVGIGFANYDFGASGLSVSKYKLNINGDIGASRFLTTSDIRQKSKIQPIRNCNNNLLKLSAKMYDKQIGNKEKTKEIGLIAQDVVDVLPDVVSKDQSGFLSVDYLSLVPLIIEAIKEQQEIIDNNQKKLDDIGF